MGVFTKLLQAAATKLAKGQRTRLQWNEGSVCCMMDQKGLLLYCAVTSLLTYPERLAYQLLYDFATEVQKLEGVEVVEENALNDVLNSRMRELVEKYQDPSMFHQQMSMQSAKSATPPEGMSTPFNPTAAISVRDARKKKMMIYGIAGVS